MSRKRKLFYVFIMAGVLGYAIFRPLAALTRDPRPMVVPPTVVPAALIGLGRIESGEGLMSLSPEVDGIVSRVAVRAGDDVPAGALLVQMKDDAVRAEAAAIRAQLDVQQRRIDAYSADVLAATARRDRADRTLTRLRAVAAAGEVSGEQLDSAETALSLSRIEVSKAIGQVEIARAEARATARELAVTEARVAQRAVRSPAAARVLRVDVQPGEQIAASREAIELAPSGPQEVRCEFDELVADEVAVGAAGLVRALAGDTAWARGRVVRAAPGLIRKSLFAEVAGESEDRRVREVRLRLDSGAVLPFNARVECVVERSPRARARAKEK
jgi:multidrug efflux pump subunit AcrA (membrane-fusion protein)